MKHYIHGGLMAVGLFAVTTGNAGTSTGVIAVSATIPVSCEVATEALNFGSIPSGGSTSTDTTIGVTCDSGTPYTISLDAGQNYDPVNVIRRMSGDNGRFVSYTLFTAEFTEWGDSDTSGTFAGGSSVGSVGTGSMQAFPLLGDAFAYEVGGAPVPGGSYTDTVMVTVDF